MARSNNAHCIKVFFLRGVNHFFLQHKAVQVKWGITVSACELGKIHFFIVALGASGTHSDTQGKEKTYSMFGRSWLALDQGRVRMQPIP
jgi:hypothetical protein